MNSAIKVDLYFVYRFKVVTNFYGPSPMHTETIVLVARSLNDAYDFIYKIHKAKDSLYSVEFIDKTECVLI